MRYINVNLTLCMSPPYSSALSLVDSDKNRVNRGSYNTCTSTRRILCDSGWREIHSDDSPCLMSDHRCLHMQTGSPPLTLLFANGDRCPYGPGVLFPLLVSIASWMTTNFYLPFIPSHIPSTDWCRINVPRNSLALRVTIA
jgi:hypothetical protein